MARFGIRFKRQSKEAIALFLEDRQSLRIEEEASEQIAVVWIKVCAAAFWEYCLD